MAGGGVVGFLLSVGAPPPAAAGSTISAWAGLISALGVLIGTIPTLLIVLRIVRQTHTIVNAEKTARDQWNRDLIAALRAHGIDVPIDQSLPKDTT